jgi:hypothetical protein
MLVEVTLDFAKKFMSSNLSTVGLVRAVVVVIATRILAAYTKGCFTLDLAFVKVIVIIEAFAIIKNFEGKNLNFIQAASIAEVITVRIVAITF